MKNSVTIWECFKRQVIGKLHINGKILLPRDIRAKLTIFHCFSSGFTLMHNNDPKHTLTLVKDCLVKQHMKTSFLVVILPGS